MSTPWEYFKQAARLGEPEHVPVALIVDRPWLPGYAGIDTQITTSCPTSGSRSTLGCWIASQRRYGSPASG